jgi:hypothetical protein
MGLWVHGPLVLMHKQKIVAVQQHPARIRQAVAIGVGRQQVGFLRRRRAAQVRLRQAQPVAVSLRPDQVLSRSQSEMIDAESRNVNSSPCSLSFPQSAGRSCSNS